MQNIDSIFTTFTVNAILIPGINEAREKFKNGDYVLDARLGWQMNDVFRFGFVVNNVLNREYMTRPATMMSPRTFAVQCNIKI